MPPVCAARARATRSSAASSRRSRSPSLDALGHVTGLPVHALLGGKVRDRVEYSGYLFYRWAEHPAQSGETPEDLPTDDWGAALDPAGVVAQAQRFADEYGSRSFKLKGGVFAPDEEIAAIKALAEAFPGYPLRLDPNGGWSVETSLRVARELGDVIEYLEDPTPTVAGMSQVHRETGVPLATNMCVTSFGEIPAAFAADAVQVVLSDHHYWGGLQATRELAAICRTFGVALSMHSNTHLGISLAAMTHVAAVVPELVYACDTHRPWQTEDVITEPQVFVDGALEVTDTPGLGVELDRDAMAALHQRWLESDVRDRDDVAAMRVADPEWAAARPAALLTRSMPSHEGAPLMCLSCSPMIRRLLRVGIAPVAAAVLADRPCRLRCRERERRRLRRWRRR